MTDTPSLFRRQALAHQGNRGYGSILLTSPVIFRWLTVILVGLMFSVIAFFFLFSTSRKAVCSGVLLPETGVLRVLAPQPGVVSTINVKEGQAVKTGPVLFVLTNQRSAKAGDVNQQISDLFQGRLNSFQQESNQAAMQHQIKIKALRTRINEGQAESERLAGQIQLQRQCVSLSQAAWQRLKDLENKQFLSAAQVQDKHAEYLDQQQRLADLQRALASNRRDLTNLGSELQHELWQAKREGMAFQRNVFALQQDKIENEARREFTITAPKDGVMSAITVQIGQAVPSNLPLASLLPQGALLEAELYAPSRSVGFIQPGMIVSLRYQAYPYQKFGQHRAIVKEVSRTALRADELNGAAVGNEAMYRLRLRLDRQSILAYGQTIPLKPGMQLDASIVLERRRLIEWVLEPLYSITGRGV